MLADIVRLADGGNPRGAAGSRGVIRPRNSRARVVLPQPRSPTMAVTRGGVLSTEKAHYQLDGAASKLPFPWNNLLSRCMTPAARTQHSTVAMKIASHLKPSASGMGSQGMLGLPSDSAIAPTVRVCEADEQPSCESVQQPGRVSP